MVRSAPRVGIINNKINFHNMILDLKRMKKASKYEGRQTPSFIRRRIFDELLPLIQMLAIIEFMFSSFLQAKKSLSMIKLKLVIVYV